MNNNCLIIVLLGLCMIYSVASQQYVQVWSDEFNGNQIDRSKWRFETGNNGWGNNELQFYTDRQENARVQDGNLIMTARREDYGGSQYTSSRLNTQGLFSITYGKFTMRAKIPYGQGIWPAFWLLGDNIGQVGWPACGEVDIMEFIGRSPDTIYASLHAPGYDTTGAFYGGRLSDDFHEYSVDWHPDVIRFAVNGNVYSTIYKSQAPGGNWPFEGKNFFIILNLAVGGNWPGYPDGSTRFPQEYTIDWIRVEEQVNGLQVSEDQVQEVTQ